MAWALSFAPGARGDEAVLPTQHYNAGLGTGWVTQANDPGAQFWVSAAYGWEIAKAPVYLELNLVGQREWSLVSFSFGLQYRFDASRTTSPYLGADGGFGVNSSVAGPVLGVVAGLPFYQSEEVQLQVGWRGAVLLNSGGGSLPLMTGLRIEACFQ